MKIHGILVLSLLLNVYLAWLSPSHRTGPAIETVSQSLAVDSSRTEQASPGARGSLGTTLDWAAVESTDYREYIQNLRAIHCPEQTIRDIIVADVRSIANSRRHETLRHSLDDSDRRLQILALDEWESRTLDSLLGPEWRLSGAAPSALEFERGRLRFLDDSKAVSVSRIEEQYESLFLEAGGRGGDSNPRERQTRILQLEADLHGELAAILTPAEYAEYVRDHDIEAATLVATQFKFADDEEFLRILAARRRDALAEAAGYEIQSGSLETIESILGPERYQQYLRSQDPGSRAIVTFGEQLGLSQMVVDQVLELRERLNRTLGNSRTAVDPAGDRLASEAALIEQTEQRIRVLLGPMAYEGWMNAGLGLVDFQAREL